MDQQQVIAKFNYHITRNFQQVVEEFSNKLSEKHKKILILNTGGTISMVPSEQGYIPKKGALYYYMRNNPYLCDQDFTYFQGDSKTLITPVSAYNRRIHYCIEEFDKLLDSSNIDPTGWFKIAKHIQLRYNDFDSFIVLHGTDTMAYTASALSFMFENLQKTIILTGSQVPLSQPRNDGFQNILNALTIAGHFTIPEVLIAFYDKLLRGNRCQKVDANSIMPFDSPRFRPIGLIGLNIDINWDLVRQDEFEKKDLILTEDMCCEVTSIRITPLVSADTFEQLFINDKLKGLVIETYGVGNMKTDKGIQNQIRKANEKGIIIVNISQCFISQVEMLYETGIAYQKLGVVQGADMTIEAAVAKLSYLLGKKNLEKQKIIDLMQHNLRGELTSQNSINRQFDQQSQPFLFQLANAIQTIKYDQDTQINRDVVMPNILNLIAQEKMKIQIQDLPILDINYESIDYAGRTILHIASREGAIELAQKILLEAGNNLINYKDKFGRSALFEAVKSRQKEMIQLLRKYGAQVSSPKWELNSLVFNAVLNQDYEILELLEDAGVQDFNQFKTVDNRTIGHLAVTLNDQIVIEFLKRKTIQFDWNQKDIFGMTAQANQIIE